MLKEQLHSNIRFSGTMRLEMAAREAARRADEFMPLSLAASVFAVAWIESFLNDLFSMVLREHRHSSYEPARLLARVLTMLPTSRREGPLLERLQVAAQCLTEQPLDLKHKLVRDLVLLIDVRNSILHRREEHYDKILKRAKDGAKRGRMKELPPLGKRLLQAKAIKKPDDRVDWPDATLVELPSVGKWSYSVGARVTKEILTWLPDDYALRSSIAWLRSSDWSGKDKSE